MVQSSPDKLKKPNIRRLRLRLECRAGRVLPMLLRMVELAAGKRVMDGALAFG